MASLASKTVDQHAVHIHPDDNVAVSLIALFEGDVVELPSHTIKLSSDIPLGHKLAVHPIKSGEPILKFGAPVGRASADITLGSHVHVHNMQTTLSGVIEYGYEPTTKRRADANELNAQTFEGYLRPDGRVGTRNEIWVLCTVGCVAMIAQRLAIKADGHAKGRCDGVYAFTHPFGCSQTGGDLDMTRDLLVALANHPNAGGVLIVGLGCENNQGKAMLNAIPKSRHNRIRFFNCQEADDEFEAGLAHIEDLLDIIAKDIRSPQPVSKLTLGMKCGGSDGLSGLTANALLGRVSDRVCNEGGRVVLTEVPEMFGAEQVLMNRAKDVATFGRVVGLINGFKQYYIDHGENVYENPSPGNKDGGITTLEEKSMGAIQKGGQAVVTDVIDYAHPVTRDGLTLLRGPGNDAVSSTNLAASGANLILFTTGRGTPLGFPVPTLKVSSNSALAERKPNWIDVDAGVMVSGTSAEAAASGLMDTLIEVASGRQRTRSEINEQREIAIWKTGVTL